MEYITTSSYGRMIGTVPNLEADKQFLSDLSAAQNKLMPSMFPNLIGYTSSDQQKFINWIVESIWNIVSPDANFHLFSDVADHYNRPMGRYILDDKQHKWNYIIDIFASLDVCLEMPRMKRFILLHLPRKFSTVNNREFIPRVRYQVRVWNTPVSYYLLSEADAEMDAVYSSRIERARQLFGLPKIYDPKEIEIYERTDYYIRRAIFNETADMFKSRASTAS